MDGHLDSNCTRDSRRVAFMLSFLLSDDDMLISFSIQRIICDAKPPCAPAPPRRIPWSVSRRGPRRLRRRPPWQALLSRPRQLSPWYAMQPMRETHGLTSPLPCVHFSRTMMMLNSTCVSTTCLSERNLEMILSVLTSRDVIVPPAVASPLIPSTD